MIYLTRKEHFNAAHRLSRDDWSDDKNAEVFGKCANRNWHGHNFDLHVTVKGEPDPLTGFVMDLKKMSDILRNSVIEELDHKNLNVEVAFLKGIMPSTENLAIGIWNRLWPLLKTDRCELYSIKLYETENNYVEYFGPNQGDGRH